MCEYLIVYVLHWNIWCNITHGANCLHRCAYFNCKVQICIHTVFALHMCVVCSWRTCINLLWGKKTRRKSTCYAAVSEVMRPSQNANRHQCIKRVTLGWLNVLPYLWPLDCPCMHHFSLTLSCFLSFALLSCAQLPFAYHFVAWSCRDGSGSIRIHSLT